MSIQLELGFNDAPLRQGISAAQARLNELQSQITQLNSVIANTTSQEALRNALSALGEKQKEVRTITNGLKGSIKELADESTKAAAKINSIPKPKAESFTITSAVKTAGGDEINALQLRVNQYTASIERLNKVIANTKSQTQLTNALAALSQRQSELNTLTRLSAGAFELDSKKKDQAAKITNQATFALNNFNRVIQDAPYGLRGVANNIDPLVESFRTLSISTKNAGGPFKALKEALTSGAGIAFAISTVTSLLITFGDRIFNVGTKLDENKKKINEQAEEYKRLKDVIDSLKGSISDLTTIFGAGANAELVRVNALIAVVKNLSASDRERANALEQLKAINKSYFGDIDLSAAGLDKLTKRQEEYTDAIKNQQAQTGFINNLQQAETEIAKVETNIGRLEKKLIDLNTEISKTPKFTIGVAAGTGTFATPKETEEYRKLRLETEAINSELAKQKVILNDLNTERSKYAQGLIQNIDLGVKFRPLNEKDKKELEDKTKQIIAEAKRISKATEGFLDLKLGITVFDTEKEALKKAQDFLDKFRKGLYKLVPIGGPPVIEFPVGVKPPTAAELKEQLRVSDLRYLAGILMPTESEAAINETARSLRDRFLEGLKPRGEKPTDIFGDVLKDAKTIQDLFKTVEGVAKFEDLVSQIEDLKEAYKELGLTAPKIELSGPLFAVIANIKKAKEELEDLQKQQKKDLIEVNKIREAGDLLNTYLAPAFRGFFDELEKGGNVVNGFFRGFAESIKQVIEQFITLAAVSGILALLGIGTFRTNFAALSGISGRASGGPVSGNTPYLVGERGPELFVPAVSGSIVPNNSVGGFFGGGMGSGGGRSSVLRGQDILLAYARTQRSQLRVNG